MKNFSDPDVQSFLVNHLHEDPAALMLRKSPFPQFSMRELVQQLKGMQVAEKKFPDFLKPQIVFPPHLNLEQTSSQATAVYKKSLVKGVDLLDLTSGFGIDAYFIGENFGNVTLVEQNAELMEMVSHNWKVLNRNARFITGSLQVFLQSDQNTYDVIFLDPARRDQNKNKVFFLQDLSPDILELQDELLKRGKQILVKLSPLIDLKYLLTALKGVKELHLVAVKNEMKEVLVLMSLENLETDVRVTCVNLETEEPAFEFYWKEAADGKPVYSEVMDFLYLPNNAVLKSGAFDLLASRYNLRKLHPNTQLYTSDIQRNDFPGRVFRVKKVDARTLQKGARYNVISKNYPLKPEEIRKKYKLKDGGTTFLIFTQSLKEKIILQTLEN